MEFGWNWYTILGVLIFGPIVIEVVGCCLLGIITLVAVLLGGSGYAIYEIAKTTKGRTVLLIISGILIGIIGMWLASPSKKKFDTVQVTNPNTGEVKEFRVGTKLRITYKDDTTKEIPIENAFEYSEFLKKNPSQAKSPKRIDLLIPED